MLYFQVVKHYYLWHRGPSLNILRGFLLVCRNVCETGARTSPHNTPCTSARLLIRTKYLHVKPLCFLDEGGRHGQENDVRVQVGRAVVGVEALDARLVHLANDAGHHIKSRQAVTNPNPDTYHTDKTHRHETGPANQYIAANNSKRQKTATRAGNKSKKQQEENHSNGVANRSSNGIANSSEQQQTEGKSSNQQQI